MDGGTVWNINAQSAINQCLNGVVDDESQIILDVISCGYENEAGGHVSDNAIENWIMGYSIKNYYNNGNSI